MLTFVSPSAGAGHSARFGLLSFHSAFNDFFRHEKSATCFLARRQ
jgi:hypothetical protein